MRILGFTNDILLFKDCNIPFRLLLNTSIYRKILTSAAFQEEESHWGEISKRRQDAILQRGLKTFKRKLILGQLSVQLDDNVIYFTAGPVDAKISRQILFAVQAIKSILAKSHEF